LFSASGGLETSFSKFQNFNLKAFV